MPKLIMRLDMRAPEWATPIDSLYQAAIQMAGWADRNQFDTIQFSEHHGSEDGYCPSPITLAAAVAATTQRIQLSLAALVLPFHNPLRLAEDLAILDIISQGRVEVVAGAGYVPSEFAMFDLDIKERGKRLEACVELLRAAWRDEPLTIEGRSVQITPKPLQINGPAIHLGGSSPAGARRAARLGDGFVTHSPELYDIYKREAEALGKQPGPWPNTGPGFTHVTRDPESAWDQIADHAIHETNAYAEWARESNLDIAYSEAVDKEALRASGSYAVVTPEECVRLLHELGDNGWFFIQPLMGGLDPAFAMESLNLLENDVLPTYRREAGA